MRERERERANGAAALKEVLYKFECYEYLMNLAGGNIGFNLFIKTREDGSMVGRVHVYFSMVGRVHANFSMVGRVHAYFSMVGRVHAEFSMVGRVHTYFSMVDRVLPTSLW